MANDSATDHIQLDVTEASPQIIALFDQRRVEVISPERVGSAFASVVKPGELAGHLSHHITDLESISGLHQQMDMIARQAIVQQRKPKLPEMLAKFRTVSIAVTGKLQQKRPVMAAVRDVEDTSTLAELIAPWHAQDTKLVQGSLQHKNAPKNQF